MNTDNLRVVRIIKKKKKGTVWPSGVCDPYQPLGEKKALSRKCPEILVQNN